MNNSKMDFAAFLANRPSRPRINPYWHYSQERDQIEKKTTIWDNGNNEITTYEPFKIELCRELLYTVRAYFREVYKAFRSEAQVLCVKADDAEKLTARNIPRLEGVFSIMDTPVIIFVLPQHNTAANTIISEAFWQTGIIGQGITPIARIHSHHVLDAYQSSTDYSTLNSNTLEMVIGHITNEMLQVGFWLDVQNTPAKTNVWVADETQKHSNFAIRKISCGCVRPQINKQAVREQINKEAKCRKEKEV